MTKQHTPGPWVVNLTTDGQPYITQADSVAEKTLGEPDPRFICKVGCESPAYGWTSEDLENARLIAAAPELLEALESIANNRLSVDVPNDEIDKHDYAQGWDELVKIARAAIAKAKGVQP